MTTKFTASDLEVIKNLLHAEYLDMVGHLATPAELSYVIIPLVKVEALIKKASK